MKDEAVGLYNCDDSSKLGCPNPCKNYIYFDLVVSYNQADPSALLPHVNEETLWITVWRKDVYALPVAWETGVLSWNS